MGRIEDPVEGHVEGRIEGRIEAGKRYRTISVLLILALQLVVAGVLLGGCGGAPSYQQISQDEAMQMLQEQSGYLIVDVRRPDEFAEGHIAGAINVPVEAINTAEEASELAEDLPDLDQVLLIYCRTGRRSKEASARLAEFGYTKVYEFGGITTWEGEIVKE